MRPFWPILGNLRDFLELFKVALYNFPNHTDIGIHPDHSYMDSLGYPSRTILIEHLGLFQVLMDTATVLPLPDTSPS